MSDTKDKAEYDSLCSEKASNERQEQEAINYKTSLEGKVERLKAAKTKLDQYIDEFRDTRKTSNKIVNEKYDWKGQKYEQFNSHGGLLIERIDDYISKLDDVRDDLNIMISELENDIYTQEGIIGKLRAAINSLAHRIENFFN